MAFNSCEKTPAQASRAPLGTWGRVKTLVEQTEAREGRGGGPEGGEEAAGAEHVAEAWEEDDGDWFTVEG